MSNPEYDQSTIKRMKAPGRAIGAKDSSVLTEGIMVYNETAPSALTGEFLQQQCDDNGNLKMTFGDPTILSQLIGAGIFPVPPGWKRRMDYGARTDAQVVYVGFTETANADGDAEWWVFKFTYDTNSPFNRGTLTESAFGSVGRKSCFI